MDFSQFAWLGASAVAGPILTQYGANMYRQSKQREFYRYQRGGYERQLADYNKNVGRPIRYPELSYPGRIRALDTGISQSYADSFSSNASTLRSIGSIGFAGLRANRSLYGRRAGHSSRYL